MLRVQEICKQKGITMQQLSERLGTTYQALYASLSGNPTLSKLSDIANVLDVEIIDLFDRSQKTSLICPKCGAGLELTIKDIEQ